ncbi:MAG: YdcF family protein [Oscillospiraceae bacterium]|nr:YdcF family protein [Oscillospiraceae bacterium]
MRKKNIDKRIHKKSPLRTLGIFVLVCFLLGVAGVLGIVGINVWVVGSAKPHIITVAQAGQNGDYDCILVLGAQITSPTTLSHMLEDRVLFGIDALNAGAAPVLLLSGDHGQEEHDEVNAMKGYCIDKGVDPAVIFLDHAGFSTYESMARARDVFGAQRILIVTQNYHIYRAVYVARALGLDADGVASDPRQYGTIVPNTMREWLARVKDLGFSILKPPPTFLGDPISLQGDATVSDDRVYE